MNKPVCYSVRITESAYIDIQQLSQHIKSNYKAPLTAFRYIQGLIDSVNSLSYNPHIYRIQSSPFLWRVCAAPRRMNYKQMAVIFNVHADVVYIQRVISANQISE